MSATSTNRRREPAKAESGQKQSPVIARLDAPIPVESIVVDPSGDAQVDAAARARLAERARDAALEAERAYQALAAARKRASHDAATPLYPPPAKIPRRDIRKYAPPPAPPVSSTDDLRRAIRAPVLWGAFVMLFFFGGFGAFAALAPLAGGAVAEGVLEASAENSRVQHLEGGVVREVFAREGDVVEAGAALLEIENVAARSRRRAQEREWVRWSAVVARLEAETSNAAPQFDAIATSEIAQRVEQTRSLIDEQRALYDRGVSSRAARDGVLTQRIQSAERLAASLQQQVRSAEAQLENLQPDLRAAETLVARRLAPRSRLNSLRREEARLVGVRDAVLAEIEAARMEETQARAELEATRAERAQQFSEQLDEARRNLAQTQAQLDVSEDIVARSVVVAPVAGTVLNSLDIVVGGVAPAGETLFEIVPRDDELIVAARVTIVDVDLVRPGLEARVQINAYTTNEAPELDGVVTTVSADRLIDEATQTPYYRVEVRIPAEELARLDDDVTLQPGMPATVLIVAEERTLLDYVVEPLLATLRHGLRE